MSNYSQSTNSGLHASNSAQNLSLNKQTFIDLCRPKAELNKSTSKSHYLCSLSFNNFDICSLQCHKRPKYSKSKLRDEVTANQDPF